MSQLIFAQAKAIRREALKMKRIIDNNEFCTPEQSQLAYDNSIAIARNEFKEVLKIAALLHEDYCEVLGKTTTNWFFITIRPDETKVDFNTFYEKVRKYTERKFMKEYTLSFEQKGITDNDLGKGFHVHIVANTTHRSKGECLRDTISTFNNIAAANCIDVQTTRNPKEIITKYLKEYESEDGHKEPTQEADAKWRAQEQLDHLYVNAVPVRATPLSIKSGQTGAIIVELS